MAWTDSSGREAVKLLNTRQFHNSCYIHKLSQLVLDLTKMQLCTAAECNALRLAQCTESSAQVLLTVVFVLSSQALKCLLPFMVSSCSLKDPFLFAESRCTPIVICHIQRFKIF